MGIIISIVVGFVVGLVARLVKPGDDSAGLIMTTLFGITGAVVGSFFGRELGLYAEGQAAGFVMSVIGAIVVIVIYQAVAGRPRKA